MGEIVGAGIVSHVPPIVLPEEERRAMNDGNEISLVPGLHRLRAEVLDRLQPDTVVVFDTHWYTTLHHIFDARQSRKGVFTSEEIPTNPGMRSLAYDLPGDPELCAEVAKLADEREDTWVVAADDRHLPVHYGTINLLHFLQAGEHWVPAGVCQTGQPEDFLLLGDLLRKAIEAIDRRVVILGAGGLSHRFWPLRELRQHETSDPANIVTSEARKADEYVLERWAQGDHAAVIEFMPEYARHAPEGFFAHYLQMVGSIGGDRCTAPGVRFSDYESAAGTGQVHVWFERPEAGWTA